MIEGLLVDWDVLPGMRVDVKGLHIVSVDDSVSFACCIVAAIVLEALAIEILTKSCVR